MALNQLKFDQLETGSVYPITASYALSSSAGSGGTTLITGSTYPITSSWAANSLTGAYSVSSSISTNALTASFSDSSSFAYTAVSGAYSSTASVALNALTASYLDPISQSLIPSTGSTYSLGSPTNKWKDLYVSTGSIYIGDTVLSTSGSTLFANASPVVTLNTASGQIEVSGITASLSASYSDNSGLFNNTSSTVFATTGSNIFNGNQTVQGNITVVGSLIAQQYVVSSSVSYFTSSNFDGSTKFGDTESDIHQFTGSLRSPNITGSLLGTASIALIALTSSYINVATNAVSSSFANTASVSISSSFASTSSWATNALSASYAPGGGTTLTTGSTYPITSSWAATSSNIIGGTSNYIPLWSTNTSLGNSVLYQSSSNIGIGTTSPNAKLHLSSTGGISAPILRISGTATDTYNWASTVLYSNLTSSATTVHLIGKSETNYNSAYFGYKHSSDGSVNNAISFGFYAANNLVNILANGNVGIGTTSPGYKLDVVGAVKSTIDSNFSFVSNRSGTTVWCGLGFLTNNVNKWFVGLRETSDDNLRWYNFTNSTERMVLTETGNLGIGTSTPASILHLQSSAATTLLRIDNTNNSNDAAILLTDSTNPTGEGFRITYDSSVGDTYFNNIYTSSIQAFNFQKGDFGSGTSLLTILNSGNVGIGTTSPAYKLDVNGSASFADNVIITKNQNALTRLIVSNTTSNSNSYVETAFVNDVASGTGAVGRYGSTTTTYKIVTSNNQYLYNGPTAGDIAILNDFASGSIKMSAGGNSNVQFIISSSGNVGIGTTSPSAKLHVNGNISASAFTGSVFGTSSWANNATTASFASTASYNLNSISSSYSLTASFALNGGGGGTTLITGSTYPITSSWATNAITASYALNSAGGGGGSVQTGSIANQTILYNVTTSQDNTITGLDLSGNKWDVSVIEEWNSASIVGDTYYNSCSLLMHFNGANGSTTFTDNSPSPKTTTPAGNAQISTVQSKFGGASLYLDGTGDYLTFPVDSAFAYGTGDFTIECWIYFAAGSSYREILSHRPNATSFVNEGSLGINPNNGIFWYTNTFIINYNTSIPTNQWVHVALCRNGSSIKIFTNGIEIGSATNSDNLTSTLCTIGANSNGTETFNGYIDELRITKGVARYTGSFVTQSTAFLDNLNVTQLQTKYVGLVGGINDSTVDYGVEKLSDGSLKIRKMSASGQPLSGSGALSASVDRVYVNVLNYKEVQTTAQSASYAVSASYLINAASGESFHPFLLG